jgi:uracil-DNA glycosylase
VNARFLFVGEQRSRRAIRLGVRWEDGRLSGKTLHDALRAAGLDPAEQTFVNLFREAPGRHRVDRAALARIRVLAATGFPVVAMGCKVQEALVRAGVRHVPLVHPAARGVIRTKCLYQAHVAGVLSAWTRRSPIAA